MNFSPFFSYISKIKLASLVHCSLPPLEDKKFNQSFFFFSAAQDNILHRLKGTEHV